MIRLLSRLEYIFIIEKSGITELNKRESENLLKKVDALQVNNLVQSFKKFKQLDQRNSFQRKSSHLQYTFGYCNGRTKLKR